MEATIGKFFESVSSFFGGGDQIPWCDRDVIAVSFSSILSNSNLNIIFSVWFLSKINQTRRTTALIESNYVLTRIWRIKKLKLWITNKGCEREVAEADESASEERKNESIMRLSWALVHSRQSEDINRGMAMLEASLTNSKTPLQQREKLYLLTVGYYRSGEYSRSRQLLDQCLEIAPDWRQALTLKKTVEEQIAKDGVIGIGITATALGLVAAGVAAAVTRR